MQQHQVQVHSGHQGIYPLVPGAGSFLGHLYSTTQLFIRYKTHFLFHNFLFCNDEKDNDTPFFFEGESLTWLVAGVEVVTQDVRTSTGSVGVMGLIAMLTDSSGLTGVPLVTGVRGSGLTMAGKDTSSCFPASLSFCMASELRMTRKWVLSDGVMVTVFISSVFSFLGTWMLGSRRTGLERSYPAMCLMRSRRSADA